jgi:predicted RNA-binding protein
MSFWIFVATNRTINGKNISGQYILETRLKDLFWGLGERTPNRKNLKIDDYVVFYLGIPSKSFVATAKLGSSSVTLSKEQKNKYGHDSDEFQTDFGVNLKDIKIFERYLPVENILDELSFIENSKYWGSYFQGGTREISESDYMNIIKSIPNSLIRNIENSRDIESDNQFALEVHLEEFMFKNWDQIEFGEKLHLYKEDNQNGRQYPAGTWSIDFLCLDSNNNFVILELKRGKTSDAVVGQILRYIGWVKENLAKPGQSVLGIIISHDIDEGLKYSISGLKNIRVMKYQVDFQLNVI